MKTDRLCGDGYQAYLGTVSFARTDTGRRSYLPAKYRYNHTTSTRLRVPYNGYQGHSLCRRYRHDVFLYSMSRELLPPKL